jgi:hypothetical protein
MLEVVSRALKLVLGTDFLPASTFTAFPGEAFSSGSCSYETKRIIDVSLEYNKANETQKIFLTSLGPLATLKMRFLPPIERGVGLWETFPLP